MPEHAAASITELDLGVDEIGGEAATHLFSKLSTRRSLKSLSLPMILHYEIMAERLPEKIVAATAGGLEGLFRKPSAYYVSTP